MKRGTLQLIIAVSAVVLILPLASAQLQTTVEPTSNVTYVDSSTAWIVLNSTWSSTDGGAFSNYTIEINSTGSFVNSSVRGFAANNRTNFTTQVTTVTSEGAVIAWRAYVVNASNFQNRSALGTFTVTSNITNHGNATESDASPNPGASVSLNTTCNDNFGVNNVLFESGYDGVTKNYTGLLASGTNSYSWTIESGRLNSGQAFNWRAICRDSALTPNENATSSRIITVKTSVGQSSGGGGGGPRVLPPAEGLPIQAQKPASLPAAPQAQVAPAGDVIGAISQAFSGIGNTVGSVINTVAQTIGGLVKSVLSVFGMK